MSPELRRALERIRDSGYQPIYNGRPSCPFCGAFVDDEETHSQRCVLVRELAPPPSPEWLADAFTWFHLRSESYCAATHLPEAREYIAQIAAEQDRTSH